MQGNARHLSFFRDCNSYGIASAPHENKAASGCIVAGFPAGLGKNSKAGRAAAPLWYFPARYKMRRAAPSGLTRLAPWTVRKGKASTLKARALPPLPKLHRTFGTAKGDLRSGKLASAVSPASWKMGGPYSPCLSCRLVSCSPHLKWFTSRRALAWTGRFST